MPDAEKEEADEGGYGIGVAREFAEGHSTAWAGVGGFGADPHAEEPDFLPGEKIEGPSLLQGDLETGDMDDKSMDPGTKAELGKNPDESADGKKESPAPPGGEGEDVWGGDEEEDVHRENVEQRWAVDEEKRADDRGERVGKVEVEQVGERRAVSVDSHPGCGGEGKDEQGDVIAVNFEGAFPELGPKGEGVLCGFADVEAGDEQRGEKDEAFRR